MRRFLSIFLLVVASAASAQAWRPDKPHLGYVERNGYETAFSSIFDQINAFAAGTPINVINPDALAVRSEGLS